MKIFLKIIFIFLIIFCAGCSHHLNTQITAYYNPTEIPLLGKSFSFYKIHRLNQDKDNQYDYLANIISSKLKEKGMQETSLELADYRIILVYYTGETVNKTSYDTEYGVIGTQIVGSSTSGFLDRETTYTTRPIWGATGVVPHNHMIYPYFIEISILRRGEMPSGKPLYHANISSSSEEIPPSVAFPAMLNGYMNIFPVTNGESIFISIPVKN